MITRCLWLTSILALLATCSVVECATTAVSRPNILWLIAEDFGPHLGCYGTKEVFTPNLDRLAASGVRYAKLLKTAGQKSQARQILEALLERAKYAPDHYKKAQREWLDEAQAELRSS